MTKPVEHSVIVSQEMVIVIIIRLSYALLHTCSYAIYAQVLYVL